MKLLFCSNCHDVFALRVQQMRECACGSTKGLYLDNVNAQYFGEFAVPLGFANDSFAAAVQSWAKYDSDPFTAFVIPKRCVTFTKGANVLLPVLDLEDDGA